ncbi:MAG: stress response translation initiation inhibitor YciH [Nanohaloarchaea archaeon]|nr:stress response translation initiation inhibitor YciH [Candidatus Nanohaloarchaea archaeon]
MSDLNDDNLPDDFDPMDQLARSEQTITVKIDTRSFGKEMTVVEGFGDDVDISELASTLKSKLACGGTAKNGQIQLQGDHLRRIEEVLEGEGFDRENIDVKR